MKIEIEFPEFEFGSPYITFLLEDIANVFRESERFKRKKYGHFNLKYGNDHIVGCDPERDYPFDFYG